MLQGFLKTQMAPGARQVMEMRDTDGCKMTGTDGDCGELGECLPHLTAFKLKQTKHCEDQTKPAGGSQEAAGPPFCDLWNKKTRGQGQRPEEDPHVRAGPGLGDRRSRQVCSGSREFPRRE